MVNSKGAFPFFGEGDIPRLATVESRHDESHGICDAGFGGVEPEALLLPPTTRSGIYTDYLRGYLGRFDPEDRREFEGVAVSEQAPEAVPGRDYPRR